MYSKILFRQIVFNIASCFSGADWTAAFIFSGSGVDDRFPDMSFAAFPPDALMAARRDHFWRQAAVERIIPLCGKRRIHRGKIVIANPQDTFGAVRAFCTARTDANLTLPCVSVFALPSHLLMAAR